MDLKKHVEEKCFEVMAAKEQCEIEKKDFLEAVEKFKKNEATADTVAYYADKMRDVYTRYDVERFEVHQFIWVLGDEYKAIWRELMKEA